jgi:hypothetical protein
MTCRTTAIGVLRLLHTQPSCVWVGGEHLQQEQAAQPEFTAATWFEFVSLYLVDGLRREA